MADDRGSWLSTASGLLFSWAFLTCCIRLWVTLGRKMSWSHSETSIVSAIVLAIAHVATTILAVSNGHGRPIAKIEDSLLGTVQKSLFASQLLYIGSTGLTRVSTAFFIGQLTRHPIQVRWTYVLAGLSGLWTLVSIFVIALRSDLSQPWKVMDGTKSLFYRLIAVEIAGLLIEIALWSLSLSLLRGLQMKLRKQLMVLVAFGCRLLLIPVISLRLYYLSPTDDFDPTFTSILGHILTEATMDCCLVCTSITALKPFLKPFHSGAVVNTVGGPSGSGLYSGSNPRTRPPQGLYMMTSFSAGAKEEDPNAAVTGSIDTDNSNMGPPPRERGKVYTRNHGKVTTVVSSQHNEDSSGLVDSTNPGVIQATTDWNIRYDSQERLT